MYDRRESQELIAKCLSEALAVQKRAYAPYSKFMVGAAILTAGGKIHVGCNVESADYDGTHAEESALSAMVAAGERSPTLVVAVGSLEGQEPQTVLPCGKCRQKLWEFASLSERDLLVVLPGSVDQTYFPTSGIPDLLPFAFGPASLGVDLTRYRR